MKITFRHGFSWLGSLSFISLLPEFFGMRQEAIVWRNKKKAFYRETVTFSPHSTCLEYVILLREGERERGREGERERERDRGRKRNQMIWKFRTGENCFAISIFLLLSIFMQIFSPWISSPPRLCDVWLAVYQRQQKQQGQFWIWRDCIFLYWGSYSDPHPPFNRLKGSILSKLNTIAWRLLRAVFTPVDWGRFFIMQQRVCNSLA